MKRPTPTKAQFTAYESMFRYFNTKLFGGRLPPCILNFSRRTKTLGFFAPQRWERRRGEVRHEISINPNGLKNRMPVDIVSTLVHEMVHLWQHENGKPSRVGYHNHQWADKMESVGLIASDTGEPGGSRVGQRMSHYIVKDGPFDVAFKAMPAEYLLPWKGIVEPESKKSTNKNKVKYTCAGCEANVWGKPDLNIVCGDCDESFEPA